MESLNTESGFNKSSSDSYLGHHLEQHNGSLFKLLSINIPNAKRSLERNIKQYWLATSSAIQTGWKTLDLNLRIVMVYFSSEKRKRLKTATGHSSPGHLCASQPRTSKKKTTKRSRLTDSLYVLHKKLIILLHGCLFGFSNRKERGYPVEPLAFPITKASIKETNET